MIKIPGVRKDELSLILNIFKTHLPASTKIFLFGSRVNGNYRKNSDLDIIIENDLALPFLVIGNIKEAFDESNLTYKIDLLESSRVNSEIFKNIQSQNKVQIFPCTD